MTLRFSQNIDGVVWHHPSVQLQGSITGWCEKLRLWHTNNGHADLYAQADTHYHIKLGGDHV